MLFIDFLIIFLGNVVMANAQTCYFPDGSVSPHDSPCQSSSMGDRPSACCDPADTCLNNGLCLAQWGGEVISRGSCTDRSWQSPACSQYCADGKYHSAFWKFLQQTLSLYLDTDADFNIIDNPGGGAPIHLINYFHNQPVFCCGVGFANNNTCLKPTNGSTATFFIKAGLVIFNRTSGSTSPNDTDTTPVTVTATVTTAGPVSASTSLSTTRASSSSSSRTGTAVGAGVSGALALLLLVTLAFLLREKRHKQSFKKDAKTWEVKYADMVQSQKILVESTGVEHRPPQPFNGSELHGESRLPHQLDGWNPSELHDKPRSPNQLEC